MACCDSKLPFNSATSAAVWPSLFLSVTSAPASIRMPIIGGIVVGGGNHQRRDAVLRLGVDVGAALDQALRDVVGRVLPGTNMAPSAGEVWPAAIISGVSASRRTGL